MYSAPLISIVTPSFGQGQYLEEAILSVLQANCPNVEYSVLDGGSTDDSVEIIRKYSNRLNYWRSRPDGGQAHALIEGFQASCGDILAWINSDDYYLPGTLEYATEFFSTHPEVDLLIGNAIFVDSEGEVIGRYESEERPFKDLVRFWRGWPIPQPATFFRRRAYDRVSGIRTDLHYALDFDLFLRMAASCRMHFEDRDLAAYRIHHDSKTSDWGTTRINFWKEAAGISRQYWPPRSSYRWWHNAFASFLHLRRAAFDSWKGHLSHPKRHAT